MAEEYVVSVDIENKEDLERLQEQVARTAKSVELLSESVKKLAENQKDLIGKLRDSTQVVQEGTRTTQTASKTTKQYTSLVQSLRIAFVGVASAAGLAAAAINSKKVALGLANKIQAHYIEVTQKAAQAVVSFAQQHRTLGTLLTQTIRVLSVVTSSWKDWAKGAVSSVDAVRLSLGTVRNSIVIVLSELQRGISVHVGAAFSQLTSKLAHFAVVGRSTFASVLDFVVKVAASLGNTLTPALLNISRLFLKLSNVLSPIRTALTRLFVGLRFPDVATGIVTPFLELKRIIVDVSSIITAKLVTGLRSAAPVWSKLLQISWSLWESVTQIGRALETKLAGKLSLATGFVFLGTVLDKVRDKILRLGADINERLGGKAVSVGAQLAKPFIALIGSLTILTGKFLKLFPATKRLGSALTTLGYSLASVSSFSRSWSMVMSRLNKTLPGVGDHLQRVSRGFSDLTGRVNVQTDALYRFLNALGKVALQYFLVFKMNISLAHAFEALGERLSYTGEIILERFSEVYRVSSEMIRTQTDLGRAVRRYVELTGDASMSARDWLQWSDKLALSAGKNVSEMRRVTGALLDFAALYRLNQKETKRFISLMVDVSSFLGTNVFDALQHVHGALAGLPRSAQILGINIDHLREKTKFYEEQLRKEGEETGSSIKQKARMLALIQELSYLQGVNNQLMQTGYGILQRYRVSQELLAAQTGNYVSPILNAYYKLLTRINEVMAEPGVLGFVTTMKAVGGVALELTGRLVKLAAKLFILIETVSLAEKAMTALNAAFDVFGLTQKTVLAPLFVMENGLIKTRITASSLGKVLRNLGAYISTKFINFFREGGEAVKGLAVEIKTALATLLMVRFPRTLFGPALIRAMAAEEGMIRKLVSASKLMQATFMAEGLILSGKVTPAVLRHAKQVRDLYLATKDVVGAQRAWAGTITTFAGVSGLVTKAWYTLLGVLSKVGKFILGIIGVVWRFLKTFGLILVVIPAVYKAFKDALIPAFKDVFGNTQALQAVVSILGGVLRWFGKLIVQIVTGPIRLLATGIAGTVGVISVAVGQIIRGTGALLHMGSVLLKLGRDIPFIGKKLGLWGESLDSASKELDKTGRAITLFGLLSIDNARAILGLNKVLQANADHTAKLRRELAETMRKRQEELGLNLASARTLERVVNAIQEYQDTYSEFVRVQEEIRKGRTQEGKQLRDEETLNRKSTEAVQELSKSRQALVESIKAQFEVTEAQIGETKTLVDLFSKYARVTDNVSAGQEATLRVGQLITQVWQGLNQVTQGNLSGIKVVAEAYQSLANILSDMATKSSPALRAALLAESRSYERQAEILYKVLQSVEGKIKVDERLIETSLKVTAAQRAVNSELERHQRILKLFQTAISDTTGGLSQFASVYSEDVSVSAKTAAQVQLALAKIAEEGARRYEEAVNGNIGALKKYRDYLESVRESQENDLTSVVKDVEGRRLLNSFLESQVQTVNNLIEALEREGRSRQDLSVRTRAHLEVLKAHNRATLASLNLRKLLLDLWKSEFAVQSRLNALTLGGLTLREKRAQAERYLSEALRQSIEQYREAGFTLKAFDDYEKGNISTTAAARQAVLQLQGRTDSLSQTIRDTLLNALSQAISQQREYTATTVQTARRIRELEKVIHPTYTAFGNYANLISTLVDRSRELARQTGISSLAFNSSSVTVDKLASYLISLSAHQVDFNNISRETARTIASVVEKLLNLTKVDAFRWGSTLSKVFEDLQGKTRDFISANDFLRPALLNTIFGFRGLIDRVKELNSSLIPVMQRVLDNATVMYGAKDANSAYGEGLNKITALEEQVRAALNAVLPQLNAQVQILARGGAQTADTVVKTQDYVNMISILISQLNTLTDAEERLRRSRQRNLELSSSLIFSAEQMQRNVSELANVAVQELIQQYKRAGVSLSESQKQALEEITRTITTYTKLTELARKRVDTFTTFVNAKLMEQARIWVYDKETFQSFVIGLKTLGASAASGILKNLSDIGAKIEEMGGYFGALGLMVQENLAKTAVNAFDKLNNAIVGTIVYGKKFQLNWQEIIQSFIAGLLQAMLQLIEFKLAVMALQAMGFTVPGMKSGGPVKKQTGGPVPGQGRGDRVPALLEPGEYVVPRPVVDKIGVEFFEALRRGVTIPSLVPPRHYQSGGFVTPMYQPEQKVTVVTIFDEKELNKYYSSPAYGRVIANNIGERIARRVG